MAATVTKQVLVDGIHNTVVKYNILGDSAGDLTAAVLYHAADFVAQSTKNKLWRIEYTLNGFSAQLFWDATAPVALISLETDHAQTIDFSTEGGLINNGGAGQTGDIKITTTGLTTGDNGYIIFYLKQRSHL